MQQEFRTNLNLLPGSYRRLVRFRSALCVWAAIWAVGLSPASFVLWRADSAVESLRKEVSKYERMYAPVEELTVELGKMRARLVAIKGEEAATAYLKDDRPALALLGIISRAVGTCRDRLQVRECQLQRVAGDSSRLGVQRQMLTIRGRSLDLVGVTKFHSALRDAGMFDHVALISSAKEPIGDATGHAFHVECLY